MNSLHLAEAFLVLENSDTILQMASQMFQVPNLLAMVLFLLMLLRLLLAFNDARAHSWLMLNLLSIRTYRSFSAKLSSCSPGLIVASRAYCLPDTSLSVSFDEFMMFLSSLFVQHVKIPLKSNTTLPSLVPCVNLLRAHSVTSPIIEVKSPFEQYTLHLCMDRIIILVHIYGFTYLP